MVLKTNFKQFYMPLPSFKETATVPPLWLFIVQLKGRLAHYVRFLLKITTRKFLRQRGTAFFGPPKVDIQEKLSQSNERIL